MTIHTNGLSFFISKYVNISKIALGSTSRALYASRYLSYDVLCFALHTAELRFILSC